MYSLQNLPFKLVLTIMSIMFFLGCEGTKKNCDYTCNDGPCKINCKESISDENLHSITSGFDKKQYRFVSETIKIEAKEYNPQKLDTIRNHAFILALDKLARQNFGSGAKEVKIAFEKDKAFDLNELAERKTQISNIVSIYEEQGNFDCSKCDYSYSMTIMIPENKEYQLPEEIRNLIYQYLRKDNELEKLRLENDFNGEITINIAQVVLNLVNNVNFNSEMRPLWLKYEEVLRYLDPETLQFIKESSNNKSVINFPSGSFQLNSISSMIINDFYDRLENLLLENSKKKYEIICSGYTDAVIVKSPIQYEGDGQFTDQIGYIIKWNDSNNLNIAPTIESNLELSYARAFGGFEYLLKKFREKGEVFLDRENLKLSYSGKGVDRDAKDKWQKRRVEFLIKEIPQ